MEKRNTENTGRGTKAAFRFQNFLLFIPNFSLFNNYLLFISLLPTTSYSVFFDLQHFFPNLNTP